MCEVGKHIVFALTHLGQGNEFTVYLELGFMEHIDFALAHLGWGVEFTVYFQSLGSWSGSTSSSRSHTCGGIGYGVYSSRNPVYS